MKGITQLFLTVIIWLLVFALVVGMCGKAAGAPSTGAGGSCWGPDQATRNRIAQEKAAHDIEEDARMRGVTRDVVRTIGYAFAALVLCGGGLLLLYGVYHAGQGAYKYFQGCATARRAVQVSLAVTKDGQLTTGTLHVQGVEPKRLAPAFAAMGASVAPSSPPLLSRREAEGLLRVALGSEYALLTPAQREVAIRRLLMAPSIEPLALAEAHRGEGGEENAEIDSVVQRDKRADSGK